MDGPSPPRESWPRRSLVCFGAVALGIGEVFFSLILQEPDRFPRLGNFHLWTLAWTLLVPGAAVLGLDLWMDRGPDPRRWRIWRALLLGALALSVLRQIQISHPRWFAGLLWGAPPLLLSAAIVSLAAGAALKRPREAGICLLALAAAGGILTGRYVARSGVWGPAWDARDRGARSGGDPAAPPVFIVVFDELAYEVLQDGDRIREAEFPALARLARDGAFFTAATSNHLECKPSVSTILTGRLQPERGTPSLLDLLGERREVILFDTFRHAGRWVRPGEGVRRVYFKGNPRYFSMGPPSAFRYLICALRESPFLTTALGETWAQRLQPAVSWKGLAAREWTLGEHELLLSWIREDASPGRVTYWHCALPHGPFVYARDGEPHGRETTLFRPDRKHGREIFENYRAQAGFADLLLGRLLDRLRSEGLYDRSIVAVTSDHGLRTWYGELEPGAFPAARSGLAPRVPLILKAPGLAPGPRAADYQHVDFTPTLLRLLDIPYDPAAFEGRPALEERAPRRKVFIDRDGLPRHLDPATGLWRKPEPGIPAGF